MPLYYYNYYLFQNLNLLLIFFFYNILLFVDYICVYKLIYLIVYQLDLDNLYKLRVIIQYNPILYPYYIDMGSIKPFLTRPIFLSTFIDEFLRHKIIFTFIYIRYLYSSSQLIVLHIFVYLSLSANYKLSMYFSFN